MATRKPPSDVSTPFAAPQPSFRSGAVARMAGMPVSTLRIWEQRYQAVGPTTFTPDPTAGPGVLDAVGRRNSVGRAAVAVPGNLMAWCQLLQRHGSLTLAVGGSR